MVQRIEMSIVDDLVRAEGRPDVTAAETVKFALDGVPYEIDLTAKHAGELRTTLAPYIAAARKMTAGKRSRPARDAQTADLAKIRAWGRENGFQVNDRGRVPVPVVEKYKQAHSKSPVAF